MADLSATPRQGTYNLAKQLLNHGSVEVVHALARVVSSLSNEQERQGLLEALREVHDPVKRDMVWQVFAQDRTPELKGFLQSCGWLALQPAQLHLFSQLLLQGPVPDTTADQVADLLAYCEDADPQVAAAAYRSLTHLQNPMAQEELCRWVVEHDHPFAKQAAREAGYTPREALLRAVYFLVTGQWERYASLDYDHQLLRIFLQTASPSQRRNLAEYARQSGWTGYVNALAGERGARHPDTLSQSEWYVVIALASRAGNPADAWRLAQVAPARWSAQLIVSLAEAGWQPKPSEDQSGFADLVVKARACLALSPPGFLVYFVAGLPGHTRPITCLAFQPQSAWLASGSSDRSIRVWQLPDGAALYALEAHTRSVETLVVHPQGKWLASGSADHTICLWETTNGQLLKILGGHAAPVTALAFHPHGEYLASGDLRSVRLWQIPSTELAHIFTGLDGRVQRLDYSLDGNILLASDEGGAMCAWAHHSTTPAYTLMEEVATWTLARASGWIATTSPYGRLRLWHQENGALRANLEGRSDGRALHACQVQGDINENPMLILAGSDYKSLAIWQPQSTPQPTLLNAHSQRITGLAISANGRLLISAGEDQMLHLWRLPAGELLQTLGPFPGPVRRLAFSQCGTWLATADDANLRLWSVLDLERLFETPLSMVRRQDLDQAQTILGGLEGEKVQAGRVWLAFTRQMENWRRRFDIELGEIPRRITIGEFDIELD